MHTQVLRSISVITLLGCGLLCGAARTVVNVAALDAKGQLVTDLTSADFQIFEDGRLQPISSFKANAAATPAPATLILLDLLNAAGGRREFLTTLIDQALEPLGPGDAV